MTDFLIILLGVLMLFLFMEMGDYIEETHDKEIDLIKENHIEILNLIKKQTKLNIYNDKSEVEFFRSLKKAGRNRNTKENVRGN